VILTFIIKLVLGIVTALGSLLPAWDGNTGTVTDQASGFGSILGSFNDYLPEHLIVSCLALLISVRLLMFGWNGLRVIWSMIPGKAT
jgi:hypothetical protein